MSCLAHVSYAFSRACIFDDHSMCIRRTPRPDLFIHPPIHPSIHPVTLGRLNTFYFITGYYSSPRAVLSSLVLHRSPHVSRAVTSSFAFRNLSRFWTGRGSVLDIIVKIENKVVFRDVMCYPWSTLTKTLMRRYFIISIRPDD